MLLALCNQYNALTIHASNTGIQDNYTFAQPGIQTLINKLKDLVSRIDCGLNTLQSQYLMMQLII